MKGMSNVNKVYPCPYYVNTPMYNVCKMYPCPYCANPQMYNSHFFKHFTNQYIPFTDEAENDVLIKLKDYGPEPFVVNIEEATKQNNTYRTTLWTGSHLQLTLMSIRVGEDIGLEVHQGLDQFIRIEEGQGLVKMGESKYSLDFQRKVYDDFAFIIPAGKWHNLINTGDTPLKLYSIYAPPQHPRGTVHETKADAQAAEDHRGDYYQKIQIAPRQTKEFTLSELAQNDGTMGKPAYVAVNGIVYDVSDNSKWVGAVHYGLTAGKDLSSQFESCHGASSKLAKLPNVGVLKG